MDFSRWAVSESNIEEPQVEENVDKMGDILNNFMEPDEGVTGVIVLMNEQWDQTNILMTYLHKLRLSCTQGVPNFCLCIS